MNKEEIEKMSEEERLYQLSWSDTHEFGTAYAYYLLEENKQLKELCDKYEEEHSTTFQEWVFDKRENKRLQERIDKAIDLTERLIQEYKLNYGEELSKMLMAYNNLLEILRGNNE